MHHLRHCEGIEFSLCDDDFCGLRANRLVAKEPPRSAFWHQPLPPFRSERPVLQPLDVKVRTPLLGRSVRHHPAIKSIYSVY